MLLALKDDELTKATPRSYAICPHCEEDVIPRCGSIRIWHWAHKAGECIYNAEPETDWHLEWKDRALKLGLEIERDVLREGIHIADIYDHRTNTVIEVQHSPISEDDILDRCIYYSINDINIEWIFDKTEKFEQDHLEIINNHLKTDYLMSDYTHNQFREKYNKKIIRCIFDKDDFPDYGVSLHYMYDNNHIPMLLRIYELNNHGWGSGFLYKFKDFHDIQLLTTIDNLNRLQEKTYDTIHKIEERYFNSSYLDNEIPLLTLPDIGDSVTIKIITAPIKMRTEMFSLCNVMHLDKEYFLRITSTIYKGIIRELETNDISVDNNLECIENRIFKITGIEWHTAPKEMWKFDEITKIFNPPKIFAVKLLDNTHNYKISCKDCGRFTVLYNKTQKEINELIKNKRHSCGGILEQNDAGYWEDVLKYI